MLFSSNSVSLCSDGPSLGSDINISGYEITQILGTHQLAHNKYSMVRPHLLLLTQDPYRRQFQALDGDDIQAAWAIFGVTKSQYIVLYN